MKTFTFSLMVALVFVFVFSVSVNADELDLLVNTNTPPEMQGELYLSLCNKDFSEIVPKLAKLITSHPVISGVGPQTDKPWNEEQLSKGDRIGYTLNQLWRYHTIKTKQKSYAECIELMMNILDNTNGGRERQIALREISSNLHFGVSPYGRTLSPAEVNKTISRLDKYIFDESESIELRKAILPIVFEHGDPNKYLDLAIKLTDTGTKPLSRAESFRFATPVYNTDKYTPENREKYLQHAFELLKQINDGKGTGYFLAMHIGRFIGVKNEFTPDKNSSEHKSFFQTTVDNALKWREENQTQIKPKYHGGGCTDCSLAQNQKKSDRYVNRCKMSIGLTAVIAEGDYEPRSIGSYSVRIYGVNPKYSTDNFLCGIIKARDGNIEKISARDINGDGKEEIIVVIRCVGSGSYLSADAFNYQHKKLKLVASISGVNRTADPIKLLKKQMFAQKNGCKIK